MTTLPDPPLTSSILAYNPFFPNGIVSDAWGAYFTALSSIIIAGPVESFNGRTGAVVPASGDYPASLIPFTQAGAGAVASTVDAKFKQIINAADWGVKADGVTDDTAAMQAALNAMTATTTGSLNSAVGNYVLQLPKGTIILSATIAGANSLSQFKMVGQGKRATVFKWAGAASIPVFLFTNCRQAVFEDFGIVGNVSTPPSYCIQINRVLAGQVGAGAPTACQFHNIWCGGDSANMATTGIGYTCTAIGDDSNNDLGLFVGCDFSNLSSYGVSFEHGNSLLHRLIACGFSNCGVAAVNAVHVIGTFDSSFDAYDCESSGCAATWRLGGSTHSVSIFGWKSESDINALAMPATAGSTYTANLTFSGVSWAGNTGSAAFTFDAGVGSTLEICGGKWTSPTALALSFPTTGSRVKIQDAYFNFASLTYNNEVDMQNNYVSAGTPTLTNSGSGILRMVRSDGSSRVNTLPTVTSGTSFSASGLSNSLVILNYGSGTSLSSITNGYPGQVLTLRSINGNATIAYGASADQIRLVGGTGTSFTLMNGQQITLQKMDSANGNTWVELSRSSPNQVYDATSGAFLYSGRIAGAGALSQWGPINNTTTSATFGTGAVASSLGSYMETLSTGAINFYKTSASKVGGFDSTGNFTTTLPFMNTVYIPQGTTAGTVDYTGATDSTAHLQAILDAGSQGTIFELLRGTPKFNVILRTQGVGLRGPGMAQFTGSIASYQQPFDVTKPVVTVSDDLAVYNGISVTEMALYTPSGTGQKGLVFAGGAQKCYAKNIMSLGFTKSCIEFRNDDVNPCTFNAADTIFASTNVVGANGISFVDNHVAGTGWTTACEVSNFSTTAPSGYPVYCESAQTNSLSNGYIQTSYSGHGIYFKKTSSEVYYPRLNFSNVDVDNVSGYGTVSTVLDIAGTYPSNYRSATDVANLSPIMGELNTAANSYWAAGHTTLSANFTVAATTITLTSVAGLEAGMHIMIPGAGASGRNYFDQIVSIAGSVVTLSQHNSSTQVNSGGDVSWGDIVNAVDTRGVLSSFSNGAIVVGATNKDGVTGDGAGLIYQSNGAGQGYWSSGDFISEWKDKQFRFLGSVSSPSVTAISRVGTTVTVTTSSAHKMGVGDPFALSGIVDADGFNSTTQWQPTVASVGSSTTFTYTSLVSGSTTPANQNPTLVPYRGMHFNRGRLEFDNGTGSGIGFKVAAGTMGAAIFTDNINPTLNIWTPDTTNGTYDMRWGSSVTTGKAWRIGNNSIGDRAYLTGNGAFFLVKCTTPAVDSGGAIIYADSNGLLHALDANNVDTLLSLEKTINGSTGAVTINKSMGEVQFAAAASTLVVTNSLVDANSIIMATVATNDATMKTVSVTKASGSFTLTANAAATGTTKVDFIVFN